MLKRRGRCEFLHCKTVHLPTSSISPDRPRLEALARPCRSSVRCHQPFSSSSRFEQSHKEAPTLHHTVYVHFFVPSIELNLVFLGHLLTSNSSAIHFVKALQFVYQGQLADIAVKKGRRCSHAYFSRTINTGPSQEHIASMGIPAFEMPLQPRLDFGVHPSRANVRDATETDIDFITQSKPFASLVLIYSRLKPCF